MNKLPEVKLVKQFKSDQSLLICFDESNANFKALGLSEAQLNYISKRKEAKKDLAVIQNLDHQVFVALPGEELKPNMAEWYRRLGAKLVKTLRDENCSTLSIDLGKEELTLAATEGFVLGQYSFDKYFTAADKAKKPINVELTEAVSAEAIEELSNTNKFVYAARTWVNEPQSYLNATNFAVEIRAAAESVGIEVDIWTKDKIVKEKMGGLLAVNRGSEVPPAFAILKWNPKNATNTKPVVLVGKGVVYDTGGLSLKPTANSMDIMKCDMGGAAAMVGAICSIAANKLPKQVIALIPLTDNRPGKDAYAPGDVITMYDGTTVEVLNTDAEGRMIMADALAYAKKHLNPMLTIDAATLTGAAERAIGAHASIAMGNAEEASMKLLEEKGFETFERVVNFPFWDEYYEEMKSSIADLKNIGGATAGMITAGKFLEHFAPKPYIHIDIAGPAFINAESHYLSKGGTGVGVRLLYSYIKSL